jgi:hypothetical protein
VAAAFRGPEFPGTGPTPRIAADLRQITGTAGALCLAREAISALRWILRLLMPERTPNHGALRCSVLFRLLTVGRRISGELCEIDCASSTQNVSAGAFERLIVVPDRPPQSRSQAHARGDVVPIANTSHYLPRHRPYGTGAGGRTGPST